MLPVIVASLVIWAKLVLGIILEYACRNIAQIPQKGRIIPPHKIEGETNDGRTFDIGILPK